MENSESLRTTLESLTRVYYDEKVPVRFGSPSRAVPPDHSLQGEEITEPTVVIDPKVEDDFTIDLTGPEELRCVTNTLSHELEHIRETDLTSKAEFQGEYENHAQFAGGIINILEDQYIDFRRTQRFPGLRSTQAFVIDRLLEDDEQWPQLNSLQKRPKAMLEGVRQVAFAGYAKGIAEADDWLREYLSRVRIFIKQVRRESSQRRRKQLAHSVMRISQEYLPNQTDFSMPGKCVVCEKRTPVIVAPLLGPVCEECAPPGHGRNDGNGAGEKVADNNLKNKTRNNSRSEESKHEPTESTEATDRRDPAESTVETQTADVGNANVGDNPTQSGAEASTEGDECQVDDTITQTETDSGSAEGRCNDDPTTTGQVQSGQHEAKSDELVSMEEMECGRGPASWWNVPDNVDHSEISEEDLNRYDKVQNNKRENQSLEADLREHREKSKDNDEEISPTSREHSTNLEKTEEWRRLRDEHREGFRKLTTRDMPVPSTKGSRINVENAVQQTAGDKSQRKLYTKKQKVARGDRLIAVSADMSGSMNDKQVRFAIAAIAEATDVVGDEFLATCWRDIGSSEDMTAYGHKRGKSGIGLVCGVNEQFTWEQLDAFRSGGGTPTADGIEVTKRLMEDIYAREKLMIVITDGEPNTSYGEGNDFMAPTPVGDAKIMIRDAQSENIKTIGLYVGNDADGSSMGEIFGKNGFVSAPMENLAEELVTIYSRQLRV